MPAFLDDKGDLVIKPKPNQEILTAEGSEDLPQTDIEKPEAVKAKKHDRDSFIGEPYALS